MFAWYGAMPFILAVQQDSVYILKHIVVNHCIEKQVSRNVKISRLLVLLVEAHVIYWSSHFLVIFSCAQWFSLFKLRVKTDFWELCHWDIKLRDVLILSGIKRGKIVEKWKVGCVGRHCKTAHSVWSSQFTYVGGV